MFPTLFFLHIPKTAGTSLRQLFHQQYPPPRLVELYPPWTDERLDKVRAELRSGRRVVYGHLNFGIHEVLGVSGQYVTMLRNPVSRVISYFRHNLNYPDARYYGLLDKGMTLAEFVGSRVTFETNNHMTRIIAGYGGTNPLDDDAVLSTALSNLREHFLFAGVTERFGPSIRAMAMRLNWKTALPSIQPRENVSPLTRRVEVTAESLQVIERENRLDLALYRAVDRMLSPLS